MGTNLPKRCTYTLLKLEDNVLCSWYTHAHCHINTHVLVESGIQSQVGSILMYVHVMDGSWMELID